MAMIPYIDQEMDHLTRTGARFTTRSEGLGDIKLTGMVPFYQEGPHSWQVNLGLGLPTGSIDVKDNTPAGRVHLPYPICNWDRAPTTSCRAWAIVFSPTAIHMGDRLPQF